MITDKQKKDLLGEHFLLRHMSNVDLDKLVEHSITKSFDVNDFVFKRGEEATSMMVVVGGKVQISSPRMEDGKIVYATMHTGDVFGEIALIDGHQRSADAIALEPAELLVLERDDFLGTLEHNSQLCIDLLRVLCKHIRQTNKLLEDFTILDLQRRLAKRLVYLNQSSGQENSSGVSFTLRIPTEELIAMMGVSHDAIIGQLQLWNNEGLVEMDKDWVVVIDQDKLTKITQEDY